jgi:hypothetical protein
MILFVLRLSVVFTVFFFSSFNYAATNAHLFEAKNPLVKGRVTQEVQGSTPTCTSCEAHIELSGSILTTWCTGSATGTIEPMGTGVWAVPPTFDLYCNTFNKMLGPSLGGEILEDSNPSTTQSKTSTLTFTGEKLVTDLSKASRGTGTYCNRMEMFGAGYNEETTVVENCLDYTGVSCVVSDVSINHGNISPSEYNGNVARGNGSILCTGDASLKLAFVPATINLSNNTTSTVSFTNNDSDSVVLPLTGNTTTSFEVASVVAH